MDPHSQQTLTAASIVQQTANRIAMLEDEMKQTGIMIDNWSKKQQEETGLIGSEHTNLMNSFQKTIQDLSQEYDRLDKQVRETEQRVKEEHSLESHMKRQVQQAQSTESNLPERAMQMEQELSNRMQVNQQQQAYIAQAIQKCKLNSEQISFGLQHFEKFLGMRIERSDETSKWIRISLKYIDPNDPERIFSFNVRVERDRYNVRDCTPEVDYSVILQELNESNDFRKFVIQMRILFYQTVPRQ